MLVEVVCKYTASGGVAFINCPTESLYVLFAITAEALERFIGLIRWIKGVIALDIILSCPVVSL